jgi:hypothetical protein
VRAAVDNVEGGDGQHELLVACQIRQVLVQGHSLFCGSSLQTSTMHGISFVMRAHAIGHAHMHSHVATLAAARSAAGL